MTEPTGPQPGEPTGPQPAEPHPTNAEIAATIEHSKKLFGHIEGISDNVSDFCGNVLTVISYLSNIDQHLKEIHAMLKARIRQDAGKNQN